MISRKRRGLIPFDILKVAYNGFDSMYPCMISTFRTFRNDHVLCLSVWIAWEQDDFWRLLPIFATFIVNFSVIYTSTHVSTFSINFQNLTSKKQQSSARSNFHHLEGN